MFFEGAVNLLPSGMDQFYIFVKIFVFHIPEGMCFDCLKWLSTTGSLIYELNKIIDTCLSIWVVIFPLWAKSLCSFGYAYPYRVFSSMAC